MHCPRKRRQNDRPDKQLDRRRRWRDREKERQRDRQMQSVIECPQEHSRRESARTGASSSTASAPSPSAPPNLHPTARCQAHDHARVPTRTARQALHALGGGVGRAGGRAAVARYPRGIASTCRTPTHRLRVGVWHGAGPMPPVRNGECAVSPSRVPSAQTNKRRARVPKPRIPGYAFSRRAAPELRYSAHAFAASLARRAQTSATQPTAVCGRRVGSGALGREQRRRRREVRGAQRGARGQRLQRALHGELRMLGLAEEPPAPRGRMRNRMGDPT
jgi:hypothetical protein